ncbi:TetR/AcrR family transcriptional regulator [Amycolatopsis sp.]|jgi:AcrR family transcriptional regulator|uniref:TetR/AcrR family transcriptional regulator n=1 Tax=Amycolatopsis sp. TaxID=37632 RepID=UPI002E0AB6CE|nr:TetR/AcrR family transcriptional regulator [Amycolatopsis sp.]
MVSTRAERAASTRRKLLDAAVQLFLDKPYDKVSVHDLADAAGVAYGLIAHHFGNKRGIHREAMRQIARRLAQGPPPPGPPGTRIRHLVRDHLTSTRHNPAAYLGLMLSTDPDSHAIVDASKRLAIQAISEILDLDPERPAVRLALRTWLAAFGEAVIVWLQDGCPYSTDDLIEVLTATLAELLRQAARLDPALDPAPALAALDRPD